MPDHPATEKIVMLASFSCVRQRKVGSARPEVANLAAYAQAPQSALKGTDVQAESALKDARS